MKIMVRNRQRKFTLGMFIDESMKEAVVMVINGGVSIRSRAERMGVAKSTLHEYVKKVKRTDSSDIDKKRFRLNYACRQVFNKDKKNNLKEYLVMCSHINCGLTKLNVRKMAYEVAVKSKKNFLTVGMKQNWQVMTGFMAL